VSGRLFPRSRSARQPISMNAQLPPNHRSLAVMHPPEHVLPSLALSGSEAADTVTPPPTLALSAGGGRLLSPDGFTGILHSTLSCAWLQVWSSPWEARVSITTRDVEGQPSKRGVASLPARGMMAQDGWHRTQRCHTCHVCGASFAVCLPWMSRQPRSDPEKRQ
jgi:hypothetical protein